jgi:aminopeptidase N
MWRQFEATRQRAMQLDARGGTHPIITPVRDALPAGASFDAIAYSKGAAVIRSLEAYVGEAAFRAGVRRYLREHSYGNSVTDELWGAIDHEAPHPIARIAHDLTLQSGVPMINEQRARCDGDRTELTLTQGRYVADAEPAEARTWHVPVTTGTLGAATVTTVVAGPGNQTMTVAGCGAIILNAGQMGYFRSHYTAEALAALSAHYPALTPEDQLGLLGDTQNLAYSGETSMASFLGLIGAVPMGAAAEVLSEQIGALHGLDRLYTDLPMQPGFRGWARSRLDPIIDSIGWDRRADESDNLALTRAELLETLSEMDDVAVIDEARRRFQAIQSGASDVDAESRHSALEIVAQHADPPTWDRLHELARSAATELERREIYPLLGDAENPLLVQRALDLILSGDPPATMVAPMLHEAAVRHPRQTVEFTIEHWDRIQPMIEPVVAARLVPQLAESAFDPALIDVLEKFARQHIPASAHRDVLKAESAIRWRGQIRTRRLPEADQWLRAQQQPTAGAADAR